MSIPESQNAQLQSVEQRLVSLKKRQKHLMWFATTSLSLCILSIFTLYFQHDIAFGLFGLASETKQLYFPAMMNLDLSYFSSDSDYIFSLFKWIGWLILKFFGSFFAAFILVSILKHFHFFKVRFKSLVLRFVAWLLCFILVWTGMSFVQYDMKDKKEKAYAELTQYDQNIQQSKIAQYLQNSNEDQYVKAYLLAQTALLHKPADLATAKPYLQMLVDAERQNPKFDQYGFRPEQLWTMQQQVYGKAITPVAQSVKDQVKNAELIEKMMQYVLWTIFSLSLVIALFLYLISSRLKTRVYRIEQSL